MFQTCLSKGFNLRRYNMVSGGQEGQERIGQMMGFWTERGMMDAETQTFLSRQCGAHDVYSLLPDPPHRSRLGVAAMWFQASRLALCC